jgi:hypothetical protein
MGRGIVAPHIVHFVITKAVSSNRICCVGSGVDLVLCRRKNSVASYQESNTDSSVIRSVTYLCVQVTDILLEILEILLIFRNISDSKLNQEIIIRSFIFDLGGCWNNELKMAKMAFLQYSFQSIIRNEPVTVRSIL